MPSFTITSFFPLPPDACFAGIFDLAAWSKFRGYGPLPGIVEATLPPDTPGGKMQVGTAIRVRNTDGSVHHERVRVLDPPRLYAVRMELVPPASRLMQHIDEDVALAPVEGGTSMTRTFTTVPIGWYTWPLVWVITHLFLKPAVKAHNRVAGGT